MKIFQQKEHALICKLQHETVEIHPWGEHSVRVVARMMQAPAKHNWALLTPDTVDSNVQIEETSAAITVGNLTVRATKIEWPEQIQLSFYNEKGDLLFQELPAGGALQLNARNFKAIPGGNYGLTMSFSSSEDEKLFGMGQYQQEFLDCKNCEFELAHRNSQASVPFVVSNKGYGFLWHNPAIGRATFAKNKTVWTAESTKELDYWVTAGQTPAQIEKQYAAVTGTVPMMPEYGMGFWQCKLRYWNQDQLMEVAREYKRREIPLDVMICDFFHWPKMGDFRFEDEFFPDPEAMCKELEEMGIKLIVSVWPQISLESENYQEMKTAGYLVATDSGVPVQMQFGGDSVFLDATNEDAQTYVWEKCKRNYFDKGVTSFWLDEAEPEYGKYDFQNYRYAKGTALQVSNLYPQQFSKIFYDGMKQSGEENVLNLVRCAWAGSQRYGALVWSGDISCNFETLRHQLCAGLSMGLAGIPWWTTDIGGFHGGNPKEASFRELLVRWFAFGTFCPVMRLHGDRQPTCVPVYRKDGTTSLFTGDDNEIWSFGEENYPILKKYISFRETMRPYVRSLMEQAHEIGAPVMRTMFYEFPEDKTCWDLKDQYMFGADVLVAPVMYSGMTERSVYLPDGATWASLETGEQFAGGQTVVVKTPIDTIPVFLKDNLHNDWVGKL